MKEDTEKEVDKKEVPKETGSPEEKKQTEVKNASAAGLGAIQRPDGEKKTEEPKY